MKIFNHCKDGGDSDCIIERIGRRTGMRPVPGTSRASAGSQTTGEASMPSIRLMGFAAGALFILSSAGHAQTLQAPGKALPMGQAPSMALPQPQVPGKGFTAAYSEAGYP